MIQMQIPSGMLKDPKRRTEIKLIIKPEIAQAAIERRLIMLYSSQPESIMTEKRIIIRMLLKKAIEPLIRTVFT